jgi:hypothetical protein
MRFPLMVVLLLAAAVFIGGCDEDTDTSPVGVEDIAPAVPTGVYSITGDAMVTVVWNDIDESDLMLYRIYRHDDSIADPNEYHFIGEVAWDENYDPASLTHWFDDYDVQNGRTYLYAVLSVDAGGNESNLSYEDVFDTPRPEGYDVWLNDSRGPQWPQSGFDFSDLQSIPIPWNDSDTDIYVEYDDDGIPWIVASNDDVQLQDYGTILLAWVDYAPRNGYSAAGRAELIDGHSYIVRIAGQGVHFAKFQVTDLEADRVRIDWAFQVDEDNPELRAPADRDQDGAHAEIVRF